MIAEGLKEKKLSLTYSYCITFIQIKHIHPFNVFISDRVVLLFVQMVFYDTMKDMQVVFVATRKLIGSLCQENEPSNQSLLEKYLTSLQSDLEKKCFYLLSPKKRS